MPYREKRIYSGNMLEVEIYFITEWDRHRPRKEKCKCKESSTKQKNLNNKNARKHLTRLVNANFTNRDIALHLTYDDKNLPGSEKEARRDVWNYIRKMKNYRKKNNLPELKYIAVVEAPEEDGKKKRIHHHLIIDGAVDRDTVESMWRKGRANADRLKADEYGYEALARYISKDPKGKKRWSASKNLKQPVIEVNDYKYSKRKVAELFQEVGNGRKFEELYKGYIHTESKTEINDITGTSICIKMRKLE